MIKIDNACILSLFGTMEDYISYTIYVVCLVFMLYIVQDLMNDHEILMQRLQRLSYMLQIAEYQTGIPYYISCGHPTHTKREERACTKLRNAILEHTISVPVPLRRSPRTQTR